MVELQLFGYDSSLRSHHAQAEEHRRFSSSLNSPCFPGDTGAAVLTRQQGSPRPGEKVLRRLGKQGNLVGLKVAGKSDGEITRRVHVGRQCARAGRWIGIARA